MTGRKRAGGRRVRARRPRSRRRNWATRARRWGRALGRTSLPSRVIVVLGALIALALAINWTYQVIRKPSELFFPISGTLYKSPPETWQKYESLFRSHSTPVMTPELLAAIAQVEGSGNPVVRTYWRWSWSAEPFEVYRPASSAVGMYQITDGTFAEARRWCIRDHRVVADGPWDDWSSCWFNRFYARVLPSHAVELTAAYLDRAVADIVVRHRATALSVAQKQELAAVIHLCGAGAGDAYARRGFRLAAGERCGDHDARAYVARIMTMKAVFARLAARG